MKALMLMIIMICGTVVGGVLESGQYYTWQIPEPNVPVGSVITNVQITLHKLITANNSEGLGIVQVRLVDDCPSGWVGNNGSVDVGTLLASPTANDANSIIDLSDVVLVNSWTHAIFKQPFQISCPIIDGFQLITMNAALLEYNDYMGNGTPAGLLLRSVGGKATLSQITVKMTVRAYTGEYNESVIVVVIDVPKDLVAINAWAVAERLKLMADFIIQLTELELRIAAEQDR